MKEKRGIDLRFSQDYKILITLTTLTRFSEKLLVNCATVTAAAVYVLRCELSVSITIVLVV